MIKKLFVIVIVGLVIIGFFLSGGKDKKSQSPCNKKYRGHIIPPKVTPSGGEEKWWEVNPPPLVEQERVRRVVRLRRALYDAARIGIVWKKDVIKNEDDLAYYEKILEKKYGLVFDKGEIEKRIERARENVDYLEKELPKLKEDVREIYKQYMEQEKKYIKSMESKLASNKWKMEYVAEGRRMQYVISSEKEYTIHNVKKLEKHQKELLSKIKADEELMKVIKEVLPRSAYVLYSQGFVGKVRRWNAKEG